MTPRDPIRVLVVDDSAVIRGEIVRALDAHAEIEVVGTSVDPFDAGPAIRDLRPDVVTLDLEMPRMDGLTFLEKLMQHRPIPVVIFSSLTPLSSPHALRGLALGAIDVIAKPACRHERQRTLRRLTDAVRAAASARPRRIGDRLARPPAGRPPEAISHESGVELIALGASTGGIQALESVLGEIREDTPCVALVQHLPAAMMSSFARRLDRISAARVSVAEHHDRLERGRVLVAPGDRHLGIDPRDSTRVSVTRGPKVHHQRPAVDVLFRSIARTRGASSIGVLLTGMGSDGADGLLAMREAGAHTIAEDESSCVVFGMPRCAIECGAAVETVPLPAIPDHLLRAVDAMAPLTAR